MCMRLLGILETGQLSIRMTRFGKVVLSSVESETFIPNSLAPETFAQITPEFLSALAKQARNANPSHDVEIENNIW